MPTADRAVTGFNLWTDVQLARRLRGRSGFLLGTRPGVNLMVARLDIPGMKSIGLEQMNLSKHNRHLRARCAASTRSSTRSWCSPSGTGRPTSGCSTAGSRSTGSPTPCAPLPGAKADLAAKTVYAAGRFRYQKGFDLLIPAWAETARAHPDWRLRLRGSGRLARRLEGLIAEHGSQTPSRSKGRPRTSARTWRRRRCSCSPPASRASR